MPLPYLHASLSLKHGRHVSPWWLIDCLQIQNWLLTTRTGPQMTGHPVLNVIMIFMTTLVTFITNGSVVYIPPGHVQHYSKHFVVPYGDEFFAPQHYVTFLLQVWAIIYGGQWLSLPLENSLIMWLNQFAVLILSHPFSWRCRWSLNWKCSDARHLVLWPSVPWLLALSRLGDRSGHCLRCHVLSSWRAEIPRERQQRYRHHQLLWWAHAYTSTTFKAHIYRRILMHMQSPAPVLESLVHRVPHVSKPDWQWNAIPI